MEYSDIPVLLKREQYYLDSLNPVYNIAKIAGSTLGVHKSSETKEKISKALKGLYTRHGRGKKAPYMVNFIQKKQNS